MLTTQKRYFLFANIGLISGLTCGTGQYFLPDNQIVIDYYPAVLLGIFLYLAGYYLIYPGIKKQLVRLIILIIFSSLGWRLSINYGFTWGGPAPFVNAGALGAFMVSLGWVIAWKIRSDILRFILIITAAGAFGGLIFQMTDAMLSTSEDLWIIILFTEWQLVLFIGIALSYLFSKNPAVFS